MAAKKKPGPKKGSPSPSPSTTFKPGQSGNPAGRPKEHPEIREALKAGLSKALDLLMRVIENDNEETKNRVRAAEVVFNFGLAKPMPEIGSANAERLQALVEALKG